MGPQQAAGGDREGPQTDSTCARDPIDHILVSIKNDDSTFIWSKTEVKIFSFLVYL